MSPIIKDSDSPHEPPHLEETNGGASSPAPVTPFPEDIVHPRKKSPPSLSNCNGDTPKSTLSKSKSSQQLEAVIMREKRRSLGSFFGSRLSSHIIDLEKEKEKNDLKSFSKTKKEDKKEPKLKRSQSLRVKGKAGLSVEEDRKRNTNENLNPILRKDKSVSSVSLKEDKPSKLKSFATKLTRLPKLTFADIPETGDEPFHKLRRTQSMKFTTKKSISPACNSATNPVSPCSDSLQTLTPTRKSSYGKLQHHSSKSSRMNDDAKSSNQKSKSMYDVRESSKIVPKNDDSNVKVNSQNSPPKTKNKNPSTERLNLDLTKDATTQSKTFAHKTMDVIRKSVKNKLRNNVNKQSKMKTVLEDASTPSNEMKVEKMEKTIATKDKKQVKLNSKRKKLENNESDNEGKPKKKALQRGKVQQTGKEPTLTPLLNNKSDKIRAGSFKNNNSNNENTKANLDINGNKGITNSEQRKASNKLDNKKRNVKHHGLISDDCGNFPLISASVGGESNHVKSSESFDSRHNSASEETNIHSLFLSQIDGTLNRNHDDIYSFPAIRKRTDFIDKNGNDKVFPCPNSSFLESAFVKFSGSLPLIVAKIAFQGDEDEPLQEPNLTKSYSEMCLSESSVTPSLQESDMKSVSPMSMSHHEEERVKRDSNSPMSFTDHDAYIDDSMDELVIKGEGESYFGTLFTEGRFLWDNFNESFTEMETDFAKDFYLMTSTEVEMSNKSLNSPEDVFYSTPRKESEFNPMEKTLWEFEDRESILISCGTCDKHDRSTISAKDHSICADPIHLESVNKSVPLDKLNGGIMDYQNDNIDLDCVETCYDATGNSEGAIIAQQMPMIDHHETDSITSGYVSIGERDSTDYLVPFSEAECPDITLQVEEPPKTEFQDFDLPERPELLEAINSPESFEEIGPNGSMTTSVLKHDDTLLIKNVQEIVEGLVKEKFLSTKSLNEKEDHCDIADDIDVIKKHEKLSNIERLFIGKAVNNSTLGVNEVKPVCIGSINNKLEPLKSSQHDYEVHHNKNDTKLKIRKSSTESDLTTSRKMIKVGSPSISPFEVSDVNKAKRPKPEPSLRKVSQSRLPNLKEKTDIYNKIANTNEKKRKTSAKLLHTDERKEQTDKGIDNKKISNKEPHESISYRNKDVKDDLPSDSLIEGSATSGGIGTPSSGRHSSARDHRLGSRVPPKTSRLAYTGNNHEETKGEVPSAPTPLPRRSKIDTLKGSQTKLQRTTRKLTDPVKVLRSTAPNVQLRTSAVTPSSDQLKKLEADLSDRSRELHTAEEEATKASRGVEALTVLVHHLVKEYEAFSTPRLKSEIDRLCCQLTDVQLCLDESSATARRLEDEAIERSKKHSEEIQKLEEKHSLEVTAITEEHQRRTQEILEKHQLELREAITKEESKHDELILSHKCELERIENDWRGKLDQQHERHLQSLQELNTSHTQQFKKAEALWEVREKELQDTNSKLLKEQSHLKQQAKKLEETLLSDKDHRLQAAKSVCTALQNEVDSLKTVVEMRNTEVHKLRDQVTDRERMTDDLEAARERVRALQAKTEDLLAQMEKKSKLERQLLADQHVLAESLQRESSANKLLSLENEELQWKLKQREQALAGTLPMATLDLVTRCSPNIPRQEDGCKSGGSSPLVTPRFQRNGSRSQSILKNEFEKRWSHSYHGTSEEMGKLFRKSELLHEDFTIESPPPSPRVKGVIEKSNSVSFILDLNDTFPEDPFLGITSSPLLRKPRTPTLSRKPIQKSYSNAALEKSSSTSFILGRTSRDSKKEKCFYRNESNFKIGRREENGRERSAEDIPPQTPPLFPPKYNGRGHSTSDSSEGGDVERVSPTGLAWTVPVHSKQTSKRYPRCSKDIPHRFQLVPETPRLLQQPDEDEYEENENEFVEVLTLDGEDLNSAPLTTLFAQTPSTSVSLSDSDISQCGSRGDLSTEDDSTDDEDGTQRGSLSDDQAVKWRPQDGAGESMILPDIFGLSGSQKENIKNNCTQLSKSQISSAPSSDSEDPPQHHSLNGESGFNGSWSEDAECDLTSSSEMQEL